MMMNPIQTIDRVPICDIVRRMAEQGLISFPKPRHFKTPEEIAAYKEKRRRARNQCMKDLRDRRHPRKWVLIEGVLHWAKINRRNVPKSNPKPGSAMVWRNGQWVWVKAYDKGANAAPSKTSTHKTSKRSGVIIRTLHPSQIPHENN